MKEKTFPRDLQFYKFSLYGLLKNLQFFDPFLILFFREMGLSFLEIGILYSIREISTNILELPTGVFADSFGRKKSMIFAFISYILSFLIFYFFPSFALYSIAMILFAFGESFRSGTHKAMIFEYLKINKIEDFKVDYYGHTRAAAQIGSAISSIIAAILVFYTGKYRIIFLASIFPYILDLFLIMSYPNELDGELEKPNEKKTFSLMISQIKATLKSFIQIFTDKHSFRAIFNSSLFDGMFKTVKDYLQPILKQYAILLPIFLSLDQKKRVPLIIGIVYFLLYILNSISSSKADYFKKRSKNLYFALNITFIAGTLIILFSGIMVHMKIYLISIVLFIFLYMIENIRRPMNLGYITEAIPNKVMATALSGESSLKTLLVAILSVVLGFLADKLGVGWGLVIMSIILALLYPFTALKKKA